jgi:cytochrome c oxidase subunit 4
MVAWLLPLVNLAVDKKAKNNNWMILSITSVSACAISLCMQLFINNSWDKSDWSYDYIAYASVVLLVVTITLNVITVAIYRKYSVK